MCHPVILARQPKMTDDVVVSTEIQVDDETRAALLLFNERVEATAANERGAKRVAKAERAKDEAAAVVRKLAETDASAEAKAEAETAYKEAVASYNTLKDDPLAGEEPRKPKAAEPEAAAEPAEVEAAAEPAETSSDEETSAAPAAPAEEPAASSSDDSEE